MTRGVCYLAWGTKHVREAITSALTLGMVSPDLPTCLFTDITSEVMDGVFTHVIRSDFAEYDGYFMYYRKMAVLRESPFDVTMYVDGDTQFMAPVDLGFEKAERHGFAAVIHPGQILHWEGRELIHYNGGALWFTGHPEAFVKRVLELASIFTGSDEPTWAIAFDEMKINPAVLPSTFNLVTAGRIHERPIRLWHSREPAMSHLISQFDDTYTAVTRTWNNKPIQHGPHTKVDPTGYSNQWDVDVIAGDYSAIARGLKIYGGGAQHCIVEHRNAVAVSDLRGYHDVNYWANGPNGWLKIGSDVWICADVTLIGNRTIGHGAILGAGAVVARDVPPYAIVAGNRSEIVGWRFAGEQRERLLSIKWWEWPEDKVLAVAPMMQDVERLFAFLDLRPDWGRETPNEPEPPNILAMTQPAEVGQWEACPESLAGIG